MLLQIKYLTDSDAVCSVVEVPTRITKQPTVDAQYEAIRAYVNEAYGLNASELIDAQSL